MACMQCPTKLFEMRVALLARKYATLLADMNLSEC